MVDDTSVQQAVRNDVLSPTNLSSRAPLQNMATAIALKPGLIFCLIKTSKKPPKLTERSTRAAAVGKQFSLNCTMTRQWLHHIWLTVVVGHHVIWRL